MYKDLQIPYADVHILYIDVYVPYKPPTLSHWLVLVAIIIICLLTHFRMFPETITITQYFFWSAMAECLFYTITDVLRLECPRCKRGLGKCRSKHYDFKHYQDVEKQHQAFMKFEQNKSHFLEHYEQHWAIYTGKDYERKTSIALDYFEFHPEHFTWEYILNNKTTLDFFMKGEYDRIVSDHGDLLNWVNYGFFQTVGSEIHSLLEYYSSTLNLAPVKIRKAGTGGADGGATRTNK